MELLNDFGLVDGLMKNLIFNMVTEQHELAKKNAELERLIAEVQTQAITDMLTGLYNRRGLFEIGGREIERAKRYGHPLAAIMFDLDHFKQVNDAHGHVIGDRVLDKQQCIATHNCAKGILLAVMGEMSSRYCCQKHNCPMPLMLPNAFDAFP